MLIVFVVVYCAIVIVLHDACRYPDFVQSLGGRRDWRGHLQSDAGERAPAVYSVSFDGRMMRVVASNVSFQRRCLLKVGNRTYLAAQRDVVVSTIRAPQNRYLCLEFVRRSDAVLQIRTSTLASRMDPRLCAEDRLVLDDRPLVDRRHRWRSSIGPGCQLTGGYDVHLYDRSRHRGVCDALDAETRLEVACGGDDSLMHFRFRYDFCVPSGLGMNVDQVTRCAATWSTDANVFTVLVPVPTTDVEDHLDAWCLRRPRRTFGRPFTAFLFRRLLCDDRPVAELGDALMVDMRTSDDWGSSLCEDDYEGCQYDYQAECLSRMADCARTCFMCNDSSPTDCLFGAAVRGRWESPDGRTSLHVNGSSLLVTVMDESGRATSTQHLCVEWRRGSSSGYLPMFADHAANEHLVVTRPGGGCRPRYACVQFHYHEAPADDDDRSPSVIHFRISASRPWPIYGRVDCSSFHYPGLHSPVGYVGQHFALLASFSTNTTSGRNYVDCVAASLPVATRFVVEFEHDGQRRCSAQIEPKAEAADDIGYFRLILNGCRGEEVALDVRCLDRVAFSGDGAVLLVTELLPLPFFHGSGAVDLLCWLFTGSNSSFYLLSSADCSPLTSPELFQRGIVNPIAVFVDELTLTSTTLTSTTAAAANSTDPVATPLANTDSRKYNASGESYDGPSTGAAYNITPEAAFISATATATSRRQSDRGDSSLRATTVNQTRPRDSAPRQSSAVDAADDDPGGAGSPDHSDRPSAAAAAHSPFPDVTNNYAGRVHASAAVPATTVVAIAVDMFIIVSRTVPVVICVPSR